MKISFWRFLLNYLYDNRGSLSLTGGDAGAATGDGAGDSELPPGEPGGEPAEGTPDGDPPAGGQSGESFLSGLPEDLVSDPSLKVFMDDKNNVNVQNLIKSYVHAQRKMGEKGVRLPDSHSTDEDWANFYNQLRPAELEKYEVNNTLEEGVQLDEQMFNGFKAEAHKAGLSTKQAQSLVNWFNSVSAQNQTALQQSQTEGYEAEVKALKADWGEGFDREVQLANRAVKEFADEATIKYLKDSGLDGNVTLIRLFNKIGKGLLEDKFTQESHGTFGATKDEAQKKMATILGDQGHPYWDAAHPSHQHAVAEMLKLQEVANR